MSKHFHRRAISAFALALCAAALSGCTIYATDHDDEGWDRGSGAIRAGDDDRPMNPPRSALPMSLVGRNVRVYLQNSPSIMEGTLREMGDWVRLDRRDGTPVLIPREQVAYIEPIVSSTTQP